MKKEQLLEQQVIYLKNLVKDLEIDIQYYAKKEKELVDEIILLDYEITKLKRKIKELEK